MHTHTHCFRKLRILTECRLVAFCAAKTADENMHEDFEAREQSGKKITSPRDAASAFTRERDSLIRRVQQANRSGLLTGWIPVLSAWSRKRATGKALTAESERLASEANPELALKGRFISFLTLGWYRDALFLAHMNRTKKELAQNLLKSMESSAEASEKRRDLFGRIKNMFAGGPVRLDIAGRSPDEIRSLFQGKTTSLNLLDVSQKDRKRIAKSLWGVDRKVDSKLQKYSVAIPEKYKILLERELELRTALDASGVLPIGDVSDRLIEENRQGRNSLVDRVRRDPTISAAVRETLLFNAREVQGSGRLGKFFRGAPHNYYNVVKSMPKTLNVLPIDGRLAYLREGKDIDVLHRSVEIRLSNDKTRKMKVKRREGEYVFLEEASGPPESRARFTVNTGQRRVTSKGSQNDFLPPHYLNDRSLLFA